MAGLANGRAVKGADELFLMKIGTSTEVKYSFDSIILENTKAAEGEGLYIPP